MFVLCICIEKLREAKSEVGAVEGDDIVKLSSAQPDVSSVSQPHLLVVVVAELAV